jgi:hypothetical protein
MSRARCGWRAPKMHMCTSSRSTAPLAGHGRQLCKAANQNRPFCQHKTGITMCNTRPGMADCQQKSAFWTVQARRACAEMGLWMARRGQQQPSKMAESQKVGLTGEAASCKRPVMTVGEVYNRIYLREGVAHVALLDRPAEPTTAASSLRASQCRHCPWRPAHAAGVGLGRAFCHLLAINTIPRILVYSDD